MKCVLKQAVTIQNLQEMWILMNKNPQPGNYRYDFFLQMSNESIALGEGWIPMTYECLDHLKIPAS